MKKNLFLCAAFIFAALLILPGFASASNDCSSCGISCSSGSCARMEVTSSKPVTGKAHLAKKMDLSCSFSFQGRRKHKARADHKLACKDKCDCNCSDKCLKPKDGCGKGIKSVLKKCSDCNCDSVCSDKKVHQRKYRHRKHGNHKVKCCTEDKSCKDKCLKPKDGCGKGIKSVLKKCSDCNCDSGCSGKKVHQRKYRHRKHGNHKVKCCTEDKSCKDKCLRAKDGCGEGIKFLQKDCSSKMKCGVKASRGYCKKGCNCHGKSCEYKHHRRQRKHKNHYKYGKCGHASKKPGKSSFLNKVSYISTNQLKSLVFSKTGFVLIDARSPKYDNGERIPGAVNFHTKTPASVIRKAVPDRLSLIVVYCSNLKCPASHNMYKRLKNMGYLAVHEYRFGLEQWKKMKLPITKAD